MTAYRDRLYQAYVHARQQSLSPGTLAGLAGRKPYIDHVIAHHFPADRGVRILDLGCGHGAFVHFLHEAGYPNVVGVDRSPEQVAEARQLGIEGVVEGDLMETMAGLPAASQDVVIAFDVIEHFTKDELLPFVDAVRRVLKPGGLWVIHAPNGESPFAGRVRYGDFTHEQCFTRVSLPQLLLASGFTEVRCFEDQPIVHGAKSLLRRWVYRAFRAAMLLFLAAETGSFVRETIFSQNLLAVARV